MKSRLLFLALVLLSASLPAQVLQKVVIEEHTGAWCGYCPDGALILEDVLDAQPNAIGVSIHEGDGMQITVSSLIRSFYNPAFPQATINRNGEPVSRAQWASATNTALAKNPVVSVAFDTVVWNPGTRQLSVQVKATFVRDTTGYMRFNVYVIEDSVTGTGSNYDQVNYYNTTSGHPLQGLGNPIIGFVHNNVLRECLGSAWGTPLIIPTTVYANDVFRKTYVYTIPPYVDETQVRLVGMVNYHGGQLVYQRPTLNADEMPLSMASLVSNDDALTSDVGMQVWPNPSSGRVNVSFTLSESGKVRLEVINTTGQQVAVIAEGFTNSGTHTVTWNGQNEAGKPVPAGLYFVRMQSESGESSTERILINPF